MVAIDRLLSAFVGAVVAVVSAVVAILVLLEPSTLFTIIVIGVGIVAIALWPLLLAGSGTLKTLRYELLKLPEVDAGGLRILVTTSGSCPTDAIVDRDVRTLQP